ncbi:hypothetical protein NSB04_28470, partial [Blautia pseudococcoides]|nr:hypothetical protein [Blautia pseudococcoides]
AAVIIQFFNYKDCVPSGELRSLYHNTRMIFHGLDQMLLIMDEIMEQAGYPQADFAPRCLKMCEEKFPRFCNWEGAAKEESGMDFSQWDRRLYKKNITIQIYCRKNASMQGEVRFPKEKIHFRSTLELMRMIHQYLQCLTEINRKKTE